MALRSPSSAPRKVVAPRDSPPADSTPPTSQGESSNGAKADVARKTKEEGDHLLAQLEREGVKLDDNIASIIDDGLARIKAEAMRENIIEPSNGTVILLTVAAVAIGFVMGVEWEENSLRKKYAKRRRA